MVYLDKRLWAARFYNTRPGNAKARRIQSRCGRPRLFSNPLQLPEMV